MEPGGAAAGRAEATAAAAQGPNPAPSTATSPPSITQSASAAFSLSFMAAGALAEIHRVFNRVERSIHRDPAEVMVREVMLARGASIVVVGVGREGLMMRALAMRLFHLGLRAHVLGDMCTPAISSGDLLIASAGPGGFSSVDALIKTAKHAGAKILVISAQPDGSAAKLADALAVLPAQTMFDSEDHPPAQEFQRECEGLTEDGSVKENPDDGITSLAFEKHTTVPISSVKTKAEVEAPARKNSAKSEKGPSADAKSRKLAASKPVAAKKASTVDSKRSSLGRTKRVVTAPEEVAGTPPPESPYICCKAENKLLPMGSVYEGALFILCEIVVYLLREKLGETPDTMKARHTNLE